MARQHINKVVETKKKPDAPQFKLKKIEMPTFNSDHRTYYKWKEQFDRYTQHLDDDMKYDYLLSYVKGDAHRLIQNKRTFHDAEQCLEKEYGNAKIM